MVDISSGDKKINITVSTSGNKASVNATPDMAMYYSNKSREWAISDKIVSNEDYSSKYYANISKQNADKSTVNLGNLTTNYNQYKNELENTKNISIEEIETAKTNAISDITNQETLSVDNVNTAGETQVNLAKEQATIATTQAGIATAKTNEVVESGNNAITAITEQETISKNNIETKGAEQIKLIQNEGATQVANVQSTGFYMRDDKLYFINSQGEETEFKSGGSGLELCDISTALYVDETKGLRRYLNGQIVDINANTQAFLARLLQIQTTNPDYFTTEDNWQAEALLNIDGCVYKFVLNYADDGETVISVRLPKYPDYVEVSAGSSITTAPVSGFVQSKVASGTVLLPNAKLNPNWDGSYALTSNGKYQHCDMFAQDGSGNLTVRGIGDGSVYYVDAQADLSNLKLKNTKLKLYYFIQVATGSETENNIVNDIELNNPYSLFDFKWTDHEQNNLSWTRGDTFDWKPSATYPSAYNELLSEYNNSESVEETESGITFKRTLKGYKIALADQETAIQSRYETYGIAWYYILDTTNTQFKLPRTKFGFEGLRGNVGDDIAESLPNITGNVGWVPYNVNAQSGAFGVEKGSANDRNSYITGHETIVFDASRSSSAYKDGAPVQERATQMYLYFYVGETVQNANLIDAGRIGEQLANKQDKCIHIIDTYVNGTSWYRIWSDGWCEQGGCHTPTSSAYEYIISLLKPYANTNYCIYLTGQGIDTVDYYKDAYSVFYQNKTVNSFYAAHADRSTEPCYWRTCGYIR